MAAAAPSLIAVIKYTIGIQTANGMRETTRMSRTPGASLRAGIDNPPTWRSKKETPRKKNKPITRKKEIGRVLTPVNGRMPDT